MFASIGRACPLRYLEYQSSDNCEILEATILLSPLSVERQERWQGASRAGHCERERRVGEPPPFGDGSLAHPVLVLHP